MSDSDDSGDGGRGEAMERYRRLGPVLYRLQAVGRVLMMVALWAVVASIVGTVTAFYHGTGWRNLGNEVAATAEVHGCRRTGPVSVAALGYWWDCDVTVRTVNGRVVQRTVGRSMVTPDDIGRPVSFQEVCNDRGKNCRYGRPTAHIWAVLVQCLGIAHTAFNITVWFMAALYLLDAVLGARRAHDVLDRLRRRHRSPS